MNSVFTLVGAGIGIVLTVAIIYLVTNWINTGRAGVKAGDDHRKVLLDYDDALSNTTAYFKGRLIDVTRTAFSELSIEAALNQLKESVPKSDLQKEDQDLAIARLEFVQSHSRGIDGYEFKVCVFRAKVLLILWTERGKPIESYVRVHRKSGARLESLGNQREIKGVARRFKLPKGLRPIPGMRKQNEVMFMVPTEVLNDKGAISALNNFVDRAALSIALLPMVSQAQAELEIYKKSDQDKDTIIKQLQKERIGDQASNSAVDEVIQILRNQFGTKRQVMLGIPSFVLIFVPLAAGMIVEYWSYGRIQAPDVLGYAIGLIFSWAYINRGRF